MLSGTRASLGSSRAKAATDRRAPTAHPFPGRYRTVHNVFAGLEYHTERTPDVFLVFHNARMDERAERFYCGQDLMCGVASAQRMSRMSRPHFLARTHNNPQRKFGKCIAPTHVATRRRDHLDPKTIPGPIGIDACCQFTRHLD